MLESIKKLRDQAKRSKNLFYQDVLDGLGEIEREIAERYMEVPVDADGVPIRYDDKLRSDELHEREFTCLGFNVTRLGGEPLWLIEWRYDGEYSTSKYVSAKSCHHVKQRMVEDVLCDVWNKALDYANSDMWRDPSEVFAERADEIRELLGGDAE